MRLDPFSALVPRQPAFRGVLVRSFPAIFPCVCLSISSRHWPEAESSLSPL